MTRLSIAVAATLAAALCLLIGVVIGRDSRTPDYPDTYPPEGDDGIDPPDPYPYAKSHGWFAAADADNRALATSFWVYYRCGMVGCRTVEPHEHGGGPMREMTPEERIAAGLEGAGSV